MEYAMEEYAVRESKLALYHFLASNQGASMIAYLILILTSILVGAVAVLLHRRKDTLDPKVFLAGALLNAGALLGILFYKKRCK
jgi:membrane protein DedA with SNARE-associated domain